MIYFAAKHATSHKVEVNRARVRARARNPTLSFRASGRFQNPTLIFRLHVGEQKF